MNYNIIAPYYELLSRTVFGKTLIKSQSQYIKNIPPSANVLIIGGGTGKFLPELLKNTNCKKILYLESSSEMLRLSRKTIINIKHTSEIEFRLGTQENLRPEEKFNTIITYCFLDLFDDIELNNLILKLDKTLIKNGLWLVVDFRISDHYFHKIWQYLLIKVLYLFFQITTGMKNKKLARFEDYFINNKLRRLEIKYFYKEMIFSAVYKKMID
jgi:tRNA (cmo5U34)-methyltransferase